MVNIKHCDIYMIFDFTTHLLLITCAVVSKLESGVLILFYHY